MKTKLKNKVNKIAEKVENAIEVVKDFIISQFLLKNIHWVTKTSKITFSFLSGINRGVNAGQVSKLAKSLELIGNIRPIVVAKISFITGKMGYYIIDGQHLYNALLRLGWDIPYIVTEIKDKRDLVEKIALLNSSSKTWSIQDYVNSWASLEEDYVKLNRYFQIYDVEMSIVASILSNAGVTGGGTITTRIKSGEFKIQDEEQNVQILEGLTDVLKIIPRMNRFENRYVCSEYVNFRRTVGCSYNHQVFMKNLTKNKDKFVLATQEQEKLADMFRVLTK